MTIRIRLPGGTLKIKKKDELRRREQKRQVPVLQVGNYFIVWWPSSMSDRPSSTKKSGAHDHAPDDPDHAAR
ncbi:hypothetical protein EJ066_27515 [Mesorhizobium sp. M9A.F.Ca.ET.002.03.1.2]|uniref:hypothetical protein n=1 Tax=Mesorhizobium sp. M9A.F.Ca.ET.002.03.1.2 TaxID=2493668 RepID=UPI000F763EF2|nr:hypothetical protein [Mesorhizobium sp. M9A.F.Ca.ET.002.03.1.2]AZO00568.1 hypothetical protein EJ066_27515 [Mesorhizobium sp. M9A.F.Ca.ET.002.03.1.2]